MAKKTTLNIRCGFEFTYETTDPTPAVFSITPHLDPSERIDHEELFFSCPVDDGASLDSHGNRVHRAVLPAGRTEIRHDLFLTVSSLHEHVDLSDGATPISELPIGVLRYTLPSRYCDSDRLMDFAFQKFGAVPNGLPRVRAVCDWVNTHIEYRWGAGSAFTCASEVVAQGFGVCRDFAHTAIALCRCFNLPARYQTGYLPDIAFQDSGAPNDFHAYFQVFLDGRWHTFDARFNTPRIGRVHLASGLDAVDGAFATFFGSFQMVWFNVWGYQIDPSEVKPGDPVDLSKRLCGTPELRMPGRRR